MGEPADYRGRYVSLFRPICPACGDHLVESLCSIARQYRPSHSLATAHDRRVSYSWPLTIVRAAVCRMHAVVAFNDAATTAVRAQNNTTCPARASSRR
jgi:hypothetical protein